MKTNKIISIIIKLVAIVSSIYGMFMLSLGWMSYTYFTILSNIFVIVMLGIFLYKDVVELVSDKEIKYKNYMYLIKFLATISITLTFAVYLTLLAPTDEEGIISAYMRNGAGSLCVHLITPLLAIIDFFVFDKEYKSNKMHVIYAIIPPIIYVVYVIVLSLFGVRWGNMYAPYNFLNYHAETGWFGYNIKLLSNETLGIGVFYMIILLSIIFIILGEVFLLIKSKTIKNNKKKEGLNEKKNS